MSLNPPFDLLPQRPSAQDLLKHKFFKNSKKTSAMIPLIEKSKKEKEEDSSSGSEANPDSAAQQQASQNKDKFWSFGDTLKPEGKPYELSFQLTF